MGIYEKLMAEMEPGLVAEAVVIGPFLTAVKAGGRCGLATTMPVKGGHAAPQIRDPGTLAGRPLIELARMVDSKLPLEASLAMAAINAGIRPPPDLPEKNGAALLRDKASDLNLVVVGHFNFIHDITPLTHSTVVLELDPREGDLPASATERIIPEADVVAITGSAFSNRTIEPMLRMATGKYVLVLGPTTPLSPTLLSHGVTAAAGTIVTDVELTLRQITEGAMFRQLTGVRRVVMSR
ncbi:MAG TPA: DUF364 domain-containing protein [bacterium]|nr:DUF364 domain-containing protein [bacterium]